MESQSVEIRFIDIRVNPTQRRERESAFKEDPAELGCLSRYHSFLRWTVVKREAPVKMAEMGEGRHCNGLPTGTSLARTGIIIGTRKIWASKLR